jgi:uncharacterized membrane protein
MRKKLNKFALYLLGIFFILGGANHFFNPDFYLPLIPEYMQYPAFLNYASGCGEIIAGIAVLFPATRKAGCYGILFLLIAFLPAHIYFIQKGGCVSNSLCVPAWVAWARLLLIHPVLLYWAYKCRTIK